MAEVTASHLQVSVQQQFNPIGPSTAKRIYTFYLGQNGPFQLSYDQGKDTADVVKADIQALVEHLRAVGALPEAS